MNKAELIEDLKNRVIKINKEFDVVELNGKDKEYSFNCVVEHLPNIFSEEDYSIRVIDEGLETERAGYVNKEPPVQYSDIEIGAAIAQKKYGEISLVEERNNLFTIKVKSTGELKVITLNKSKNDLIEIEKG